jgi:hypothetical protein
VSDAPNLGLATNNELVAELAARYRMGNTAGDYRTVDGVTLDPGEAEALAALSPAPPPGEPSTWLPDDEVVLDEVVLSDAVVVDPVEEVAVVVDPVEEDTRPLPCSPTNRHSTICRCDGRGIIPGPHGHARACDCPDCAVA